MATTYTIFKSIGGITDTVGAPNITGQAGQLITCLDFALVTTAGWSKVYTGTNLACYRAPGGNRIYVSVDDTGTTTARIRCFEQATAVAAGVGQFPTEVQFAGGLYIFKSNTADATTRAWWCAVNDRACHFMIYGGSLNIMYFWGDIVSMKPGGESVSNMLLIANTIASPSGTTGQACMWINTSWNALGGHYMARPPTGYGGSIQVGKVIDFTRTKVPTYDHGSSGSAYPNPMQGGMHLTKIYVVDTTWGIRGYLPGLLAPCHARPIGGSIFFTPPAGNVYAGRTYFSSWGPQDGIGFYETTPWDA